MTLTFICMDDNWAPLGVDRYMLEAYDFFHGTPSRIEACHISDMFFMVSVFNHVNYPFEKIEQIVGLKTLTNQSSYADVVLSNVSKFSGIQFVCELFGILQEETMAFGDSVNDIDMIQYVGIGIAMGNASPELKLKSDYITSDVDKHGIAHALKYYNLL